MNYTAMLILGSVVVLGLFLGLGFAYKRGVDEEVKREAAQKAAKRLADIQAATVPQKKQADYVFRPEITPAEAATPRTKKGLTAGTRVQGVTNSWSTTIEGRVRNDSDETYSYVEVRFAIYDGEGTKVGDAWDNTVNLVPGEMWKYKCTYFGTDGVSYRMTSLRGIH